MAICLYMLQKLSKLQPFEQNYNIQTYIISDWNCNDDGREESDELKVPSIEDPIKEKQISM